MTGCRGDVSSAPEGDATPAALAPTATPSPSPTPTPTPEPIEPAMAVQTVRVSNQPDVFAREPGKEIDTAAVDRFVASVRSWLDAHLLDLRGGGSGTLEAVAVDGLLDRASADAIASVTTGLVPPGRELTALTYDIEVAADGPPQWLAATVEATAADGSVRVAHFVFVPGEEKPRLVAAGPEG